MNKFKNELHQFISEAIAEEFLRSVLTASFFVGVQLKNRKVMCILGEHVYSRDFNESQKEFCRLASEISLTEDRDPYFDKTYNGNVSDFFEYEW